MVPCRELCYTGYNFGKRVVDLGKYNIVYEQMYVALNRIEDSGD
jgi:hypothetical protein